MCTAVSLKTRDHYFGRNLDLEYRFRERVTITPRRFSLRFSRMPQMNTHYAMIGMASVMDGYPLYYEATNERGLSMAGLNFPESAYYPPEKTDADNVSPFELIPYVLAQCDTADEAHALLARTHLADIPFSQSLPLTPLHWIIADGSRAIVVEPTRSGLQVIDNPTGVLTNEPPLDQQLMLLAHCTALSPEQPPSHFGRDIALTLPSRGMGALGLPGDLSSSSRFIRAAYMKAYSLCGSGEAESVGQFFHILSSVRHIRGSVLVGGKPEITLYSSCCNANRGVYYYTTYGNSRISAVDMHKENLDAEKLISYPLLEAQDVLFQN